MYAFELGLSLQIYVCGMQMNVWPYKTEEF